MLSESLSAVGKLELLQRLTKTIKKARSFNEKIFSVLSGDLHQKSLPKKLTRILVEAERSEQRT
ncbi:hypothetical protein ADICYQ_0889 [Cyclobacterium qasimii M12-11B]|uniref:Uncharacterized protein n=1 Tax=Cyclobacterium qasimii M12-11B TaxID=641524 RepID=S7X459_9BACT|nr:hypothetical protein ADICYQ_0889 [Cyclobacterium qasimii M12-11B]